MRRVFCQASKGGEGIRVAVHETMFSDQYQLRERGEGRAFGMGGGDEKDLNCKTTDGRGWRFP